MKFPKYLVEIEHDLGPDDLPNTPLWVARTRDPFCMARIVLTKNTFGMNFWPLIVDGDRRTLADKLAHAWLREFDIYPGDLPEPELFPELIRPPKFLNMVKPETELEFVIEPHAPRLWRVRVGRRDETLGCEWVQGFGIEPEFPRDTRAVAKFLKDL